MKINRINTYILVCLLASGQWNLIVPVRADVEGGSGGVTAPAAGATNMSNKTGIELSLKAKEATDQFDRTENNKVVTFTAKDNFGFSSVKTKKGGSCGSGGTDVPIWDAKDPKEYASKVVLYGKGDKKKFVTIHKLNNHEVVCLREGKNKPWTVYDTSKTNPVTVNISFKVDTFKYTNKLEGENRTFEAKDGFVFNHVRCKNDEFDNNWIDIWKTDKESEYSKKVVKDGDNKVTIHLKNGGMKVFNKGTDGNWTEDTVSSKKGSGTGTKTGVELSLKAKKPTDQFNYNKVGQVVTYTAKDNFGFKSVKTGDIVVWSTNNASEYATKVVLDGKGNGTKKVTIYIPNNTTKVFEKSNNTWNEVKQPAEDTPKTTGTTPGGSASQSGGGATKQSTPATQ